jgi:hypothetical protein
MDKYHSTKHFFKASPLKSCDYVIFHIKGVNYSEINYVFITTLHTACKIRGSDNSIYENYSFMEYYVMSYCTGSAERSPLFGKLIYSKPKKIRQKFFFISRKYTECRFKAMTECRFTWTCFEQNISQGTVAYPVNQARSGCEMHAVLLPATRHFDKLLNNKGSVFSRPRHGVHWKRHVHRCSTTRSPPEAMLLPNRGVLSASPCIRLQKYV